MPTLERCLIHIDLFNALVESMNPKSHGGFMGLSWRVPQVPVFGTWVLGWRFLSSQFAMPAGLKRHPPVTCPLHPV
jgi:hypothetical protein